MKNARLIAWASGLLLAGLALAQTQPETPKPAQVAPPQPQPPSVTEPVEPPVQDVIAVPRGDALNRTELEGGVIAEDIRIGTGAEVTPTSALVLHYEGVVKETNRPFQSTYARGEAAAIVLANALKGWRVGLPGMKVGGVRKLTIPAALAYGEKGKDNMVPPNADVIFTVEVVDSITIEDVKVGDGETIAGRFIAIGAFTITDKDGNVLEQASREKPYIWVFGEYQPMDLSLEGMRVGGQRRIHVPRLFALQKGLGTTHPILKDVTIDFELMMYRSIEVKQ